MSYVSRETFVCAVCGEAYDKARTDAEALAELHRDYGDVPLDQVAMVCDDCYRRYTHWLAQQPKN